MKGAEMQRISRIGLTISLCVPALSPWARSQTVPPQVTEKTVMRVLLRYAAHLQERAADIRAEGNSTSLDRVIATGTGLSEQQARIFEAEVRNHAGQIAALDNRAKQIIDAEHRKHPGGRLLPGQSPPPVPPELAELQKKKEQITADTLGNLLNLLGGEAFGRLREFADAKIRPRIVRPVVRSRAEMSRSSAVSAFRQR